MAVCAGIVHQNIDFPRSLGNGVGAGVGRQVTDGHTRSTDFRRDGLRANLVAAVHDDVRAFGREQSRNRLAETRA